MACSVFLTTPAILKGLCYLSGFHPCVFLASSLFLKMSWGHYSQAGLSSVTWFHEKNALYI